VAGKSTVGRLACYNVLLAVLPCLFVPMDFRPFFIVALALGGVGCSSSSIGTAAGSYNSPCHGPGCDTAGSGGASTIDADAASSPATNVRQDVDAGSRWSALCGPVTGGCVPGADDDSCTVSAGQVAPKTADAGAGAMWNVASDAGAELTCRIRQTSDGINIERVCESAGSVAPGSACMSALDCAAGSTCVSDNLALVCRQYCCDSPDSCPSGTYCTKRTTHLSSAPNAKEVAGAEVPVCVPADNCNLNENYPCPNGQSCNCTGDNACMVVRGGGLTACAKPGTKIVGCSDLAGVELCPAGYVCSNSTATCVKLCQLGTTKAPNGSTDSTSGCTTGTSCQGSNDVPSGWGICNNLPLIIVN
jgi:hypothetical protein